MQAPKPTTGLGSADTADAAAEEPDVLATLCAALATERVALGPKAGWRTVLA